MFLNLHNLVLLDDYHQHLRNSKAHFRVKSLIHMLFCKAIWNWKYHLKNIGLFLKYVLFICLFFWTPS